MAIDPLVGNIRWEISLPNRVSPPAYDNGYLFIRSNTASPELLTYEANTGKLLFTVPDEYSAVFYTPTPVAQNGFIYTQSALSLFSTDLKQQKNQWVYPMQGAAIPAVNTDYLFNFNNEKSTLDVIKLTDGQLAYQIAAPKYSISHDAFYPLSSVLDEKNKMLYIVLNSPTGPIPPYLYAFDLTKREIKWHTDFEFSSQATLTKDAILVSQSYNDITAIEPHSGKIMWQWYSDNKEELENYTIATDSHIFVAGKKILMAISLDSQQTVWKMPLTGQLILGNNTLFIIGKDGIVSAIGLRQGQKHSLLNILKIKLCSSTRRILVIAQCKEIRGLDDPRFMRVSQRLMSGI